MTTAKRRIRPIVEREPDGRIAIYVGAAFQVIPVEAAQRMYEQLGQVLAKPMEGNK